MTTAETIHPDTAPSASPPLASIMDIPKSGHSRNGKIAKLPKELRPSSIKCSPSRVWLPNRKPTIAPSAASGSRPSSPVATGPRLIVLVAVLPCLRRPRPAPGFRNTVFSAVSASLSQPARATESGRIVPSAVVHSRRSAALRQNPHPPHNQSTQLDPSLFHGCIFAQSMGRSLKS